MLSFLSLLLLRFSLSLFLSNLIIACFAMLFFIILLMVYQDLEIYLFIVFIKFGIFFSYSVKFLLSSSFVPSPSLKLMTGDSLAIIPWVSDALFTRALTLVLYMRKLRHRENREPAQCHTAWGWWTCGLTQSLHLGAMSLALG